MRARPGVTGPGADLARAVRSALAPCAPGPGATRARPQAQTGPRGRPGQIGMGGLLGHIRGPCRSGSEVALAAVGYLMPTLASPWGGQGA